LRDLVGLLDRRGETRLYAPMLDMYSRHSVLESIVPPGKRLVDVAPHFDPFTDGEFTFYECIRLRGRPAMLGYNRARVCLGICLLPPTVRSRSGFIWKNFHSASGMIARRIAACTVLFRSLKPPTALGRLLHFRFVGKFIEFNKSCAELRVAWDGGSSYQAYADKLKQNPNLSFYHAHSRFYHGPQALISEGFMQAIDWTHSHDEFTSIAPAEKNAP